MDADGWREVEFTALREEILALGEAERSAVKFYVPAVAVVYAIPYYMAEHLSTTMFDARGQSVLWTFCIVVAELLTLAMLQSLFGPLTVRVASACTSKWQSSQKQRMHSAGSRYFTN